MDGPPLAAVIFAFTAVEAVSWGAGRPLLGLAITAVGLCAAVIADFRVWAARTGRPREENPLAGARLPAAPRQRLSRLPRGPGGVSGNLIAFLELFLVLGVVLGIAVVELVALRGSKPKPEEAAVREPPKSPGSGG